MSSPPPTFRDVLTKDAPEFADFLKSIKADDQLALNLHEYFEGAHDSMRFVKSEKGLVGSVRSIEIARAREQILSNPNLGGFSKQNHLEDLAYVEWGMVAKDKLTKMGYKFAEA